MQEAVGDHAQLFRGAVRIRACAVLGSHCKGRRELGSISMTLKEACLSTNQALFQPGRFGVIVLVSSLVLSHSMAMDHDPWSLHY